MHYEMFLNFHVEGRRVSNRAKDLIKHFICDANKRYGQASMKRLKGEEVTNDFNRILGHPFFGGIEWQTLLPLLP